MSLFTDLKAFHDKLLEDPDFHPDTKDRDAAAWEEAFSKFSQIEVNKEVLSMSADELDEHEKFIDFGNGYYYEFLSENPEYNSEEFEEYVAINNNANLDSGEFADLVPSEVDRLAHEFSQLPTFMQKAYAGPKTWAPIQHFTIPQTTLERARQKFAPHIPPSPGLVFKPETHRWVRPIRNQVLATFKNWIDKQYGTQVASALPDSVTPMPLKIGEPSKFPDKNIKIRHLSQIDNKNEKATTAIGLAQK